MVPEGYRESIKRLAKERRNEIVYNSNAEHAVILLSELIKNAERYVHIVCKDMNREVMDAPEYIDAVRKFLSEANHKMKVLITDYNSKLNNELKGRDIANIFIENRDKVEVKYLSSGKILGNNGRPINWTVSDDRSFRLERDIDNQIAFGNFYDPDLAEKYNSIFLSIFMDIRSKTVPFMRSMGGGITVPPVYGMTVPVYGAVEPPDSESQVEAF